MTDDAQGRGVQAELEAALTAVAEHDRLTGRLSRAREVEDRARAAVVQARQTLADEQAEVEALRSFSPTRIWATLRGSRDTDLDHELAEKQAAEYAVARAEAALASAHDEVRRTAAELTALGDVTARRDLAMKAKEEWLTASGGASAAELSRLADELARARASVREVDEAVTAGERAAAALDAARSTLDSAKGWATYDTFFGGGMFSDMMKYDRMDQAQQLLHDADEALRRLSAELADIGMPAILDGLAVDGLTRTFDFWFDNVFTDWAVRSRITEAAERADGAASVVAELRSRLCTTAQQLARRETELEGAREQLLVG